MDIIAALNYFGITKETIIPQVVVIGLFYWLIIRGALNKFKDDLGTVKSCIIQLQEFLKLKYKADFSQLILQVGQSNSPIVLKKKFVPLVNNSGLGKQIEGKLPELVSWLKSQKPKNGLDAQDSILNLFTNNTIGKYLDLPDYKKLAYERGMTGRAAEVIVAVYLFEKLIPQIFPEK